MTVEELIKELQNYDEEAQIIVLWHGYQRNVVGAELVELGLVRLLDSPRTAAAQED